MRKARNGLILFTGVLGFLVFLGHRTIESRLEQPELRKALEQKARDLLGWPLSVERIRYLPPTALALEGVRVESQEATAPFSLISMRRLVLGYGLWNMVRGDWRFPTHFRLDAPLLHFSDRRSPFPFLDSSRLSSPSLVPLELSITEGKFHYPWSETEELVLSQVRFKARPVGGRFRVELGAELGGIGQGKVSLAGWTNPSLQRYELEVHLEKVSLAIPKGNPVREMSGDFHLSESEIRWKGLEGLLHDWKVQAEGSAENWQTKPRIFLSLTGRQGEPPFGLTFQTDFESESLQGTVSWAGQAYPFRGKVTQADSKVVFSELELPHDYRGHGEFDSSQGNYQFWLKKERRRFHIRSNLHRLAFDTEFHFDHASIHHLDWVALGQIHLEAIPQETGKRFLRFQGQVKTDTLIVEYEPLEDFRGSFELSPEGIQAIDFQWSRVFRLHGQILFRGGAPRTDLLLQVEGLPLEGLQDFAGRPLPPNLKGLLEGRMKMRGELALPEIQSYFFIKDGRIENLDFDRAIIQFQDYPPYFKLRDSSILRGRNTFKLTGAIDLRLENFFHGVKIEGPDHLLLWKGMSLSWKEGESAVQAEKPLSRQLAMGVELGSGVSKPNADDPEERRVLVGPKLQF